MNKNIEDLNKIRILSRLGLGKLSSKIELKKFSYSKKELIYKQNSVSKRFFILEKGVVQFDSISHDGRSFIVGVAIPGSFFGELELIAHHPCFGNARALTNIEGYVMSEEDFKIAYEVNEFCQNINAHLARNMVLQQTFYSSFLSKTPRYRLSIILSWLHHTYPQHDSWLDISQDNLAQMAGLSRQAVNKSLSLWEKQNLIEIGYNKMRILNIENLKEESDLSDLFIKILLSQSSVPENALT